METRPEFPVGQEPQPATETGSIPAVSETPTTSEEPTTWRSTVGVVVALVLALAALVLASI